MDDRKIWSKESLRNLQDQIYNDPPRWHLTACLKPSTRFNYVLRYARILQWRGLLKTDKPRGDMKILEPGCGMGSFSVLLSIFGEIDSFDYSAQGINRANFYFGGNKGVRFFEADGTDPGNIPELKNKEFDLILMKEFYPLTRMVTGNPEPLEIIKRYRRLLSESGIIIVEHAFSVSGWRRYDKKLQISRINKEFKAEVFYSHSLDIALYFPSFFRNVFFRFLLLMLINPVIFIICILSGIRLSKTIIIRK